MTDRERDDTGIVTKAFEYNAWANLRLLDFCEKLSDEQLGSTAVGCYGSIRGTLQHTIGGEVSYVARVNGRLPSVPLSRDHFAGFEALKEIARWTSEEMLQLALSARKDTLVQEREGEWAAEYPLSSLMVQAITHAAEHRAQVAAIITQLGMQPPDMDVWKYMEETGEFRETKVEAAGAQE